ncbi:MAG: hypothetical protein JW791_01430 [Nanoarchaeota archaeon]|nr:hypothetical protein [Nanoarchaeota archaeon]
MAIISSLPSGFEQVNNNLFFRDDLLYDLENQKKGLSSAILSLDARIKSLDNGSRRNMLIDARETSVNAIKYINRILNYIKSFDNRTAYSREELEILI